MNKRCGYLPKSKLWVRYFFPEYDKTLGTDHYFWNIKDADPRFEGFQFITPNNYSIVYKYYRKLTPKRIRHLRKRCKLTNEQIFNAMDASMKEPTVRSADRIKAEAEANPPKLHTISFRKYNEGKDESNSTKEKLSQEI